MNAIDIINNIDKYCSKAEKHGSDQLKEKLKYIDLWQGITKLQILHRFDEMVELIDKYYKSFISNHFHKMAQDLARYMADYWVHWDSYKHIEWEQKRLELKAINKAEKDIRLFYNKTVSDIKNKTSDTKIHIDYLKKCQDQTKYKSPYFHYHYILLNALILEDEKYIKYLAKALHEYTLDYPKQINLIVILRKSMIRYYVNNQKYDRAVSLFRISLSEVHWNSIPYLNISYSLCKLFLEIGQEANAFIEYEKVKSQSIFESMPEVNKKDWKDLYNKMMNKL